MDPAWRWAGKTVTNTRTSCAGSAGARLRAWRIWPGIFLHHKRGSEHLEPDEEMLTAVDDQMLPEMAEAYHALMEDCVALPLALAFARELVKLSAGREWFQCCVKANKGRGGDVELWVEQAARPLVGVATRT